MHAGMGYLARRIEARLDPGQIFPGARSAVCVALQYHHVDGEEVAADDLWQRVARYARGDDYHDLMSRRLRALAERIETEIPGTETRWYVDTGPVLERELAEKAGLGAIGKNSCLLHPEAGSWFFLGEVFTSLDLEPAGSLIGDMCASCTQCLDSCPTDALEQAYVLDSKRCISYWTIEHKGDIPPEVRPLLGEWVFGCDICQEVCPHNEAASIGVNESLQLPERRRRLTLEDLLRLDEHRYRDLFRASPMKRAKLEGLKRNVAVAMGNSGEKVYQDVLIEALGAGSRQLRSHAAWALGRIGGDTAAAALERAADLECDLEVLEEIRIARSLLVMSS
jgi:epoxyqueuosine reductase